MKEKLQNAFKPAPERFRYTVSEAAHEATSLPSPAKHRIGKGWRVAIAVLLIAALIPTAVIGAGKLYELIAQPVDNYGLSIGRDNATAAKDYPEYVKMHVEIPEGFAAVPNTDDLKYCSLTADTPYTNGFSLFPMRAESTDQKAYIANVKDCTERMINGHQAYEVRITNIKGTYDRLYVYFEDVNVMLLIYHSNITEQQLNDFVSGISFTEGTVGDHTELYKPYDERQDSKATYKYDEAFIEKSLETKLIFKAYSHEKQDESLRYTAQISDVRITDTIDSLDKSCFNESRPSTEIADANGNLKPKEFITFNEGDGFSSTYEELSRENKEQRLILTEITFENLSDEDIELYIPYGLSVMNRNGDSFTHAETIDPDNRTYSTECCDTEITYLSPHGEGKSFYIPTLRAKEKLIVTVGILCNADMLDRAYLTINGISSIVEPAHEGTGDYTTYLFKVQNDA